MAEHRPSQRDADLRVSAEHERARALAAVLQDQAERAAGARLAEARRERGARRRRLMLLAVWVGVAWIWLLPPAWTRVRPPDPPPVAQDAQALRLNLFLQSQAIEAFRRERGRLPWVLQDAGPPFPGIEYVRRDSRSYELEGASQRVRLRYGSDETPSTFIGPAAALLRQPRSGSEGEDR